MSSIRNMKDSYVHETKWNDANPLGKMHHFIKQNQMIHTISVYTHTHTHHSLALCPVKFGGLYCEISYLNVNKKPFIAFVCALQPK